MTDNNNSSPNTSETQAVLNKIVLEYMLEQKRKRRWRWVMRIIVLLLVLLAFWQIFSIRGEESASSLKAHVGLVDVEGTIFENQKASAENVVKGLDKAYKNKGLEAVILRINSPGGSPVQADYMYNSVRYYRQKYPDIKVYAVCVDMCASAAYYVAAATDEIYANPSSLVGSIGVLYNGFGFVDTLQKLGISRRLQTAGRNKALLDPFSPEQPAEQQVLQNMLNIIHQQFINQVKAGRGNRLKIDDDTFSGLFWTGEQAKARGLIDGFASSGQLARDIIKIETIVDYTHKKSILERVSNNIGSAMADRVPALLGMHQGFQ